MATEPPFCTVCVACMIHVTSLSLCSSFSSSLLVVPLRSQLEVEVTSNLCDSPPLLSLPPPSWVHLQIACNKFLPVCHKTLKTICEEKRRKKERKKVKKKRQKATKRGAKIRKIRFDFSPPSMLGYIINDFPIISIRS